MTRRFFTVASLLGLGVTTAQAQDKKGKALLLKGKVTEVGKDRLTVNHGDVAGFMGAMTMPYKVDKVDILSKVKVGDVIEATVYADDFTLYNVKVVPAPAAKQK
ncbi:MAG: copper-binding protein [Acidobacteriota bacterium]